jgi:CheY-like chemotaxis protein
LSDPPDRKTILIVDDELDTRIFLCNLLGGCGFETVDAGDGTEGMQKARHLKPALIIIDAMMPKEAGIQMYRELRSDRRLREVPVIVMSAIEKKTFIFHHKFQKTPDGLNFPKPGAYLEKPLEAEELIGLVRQLTMERECHLREDEDP